MRVPIDETKYIDAEPMTELDAIFNSDAVRLPWPRSYIDEDPAKSKNRI